MNTLVWFRNDLRLHDHAPLTSAVQQGKVVLPVYCFDPRHWQKTSFGFPKTADFRTQFLTESVMNLRENLRSRGSDLLIRLGEPELIIPELVKAWQIEAVFYHQEVTTEEKAVARSLQKTLKDLGCHCQSFWGHTLYDPQDLPFAIANLPEVFTNFRKQSEKHSAPADPLPTPRALPPIPEVIERGICPEYPSAVSRFMGGETAGKARVKEYFWERDYLRVYKETRNGMLVFDDSSKFSPWLAHGCLSPRWICTEVKQYESERVANDSTYWLIFELLWRDYFRFIAAKHGDRLFCPSGLRGLLVPWQEDWERFELWRTGHTGFPLVDANMRELAATGYMSNRGRQNVASFLTKNLGISWLMGAEWFESLLIDYDVCSNYGNWNYTAGVGNDARGFRFFNILKQSQDYDPKGDYVRHWLPELADVPASKIHRPWELLPVEQKRFGVNLGVDYPLPVVDLFRSAKHNEALYDAAPLLCQR
ncbi:MAG: DASH family cryptochrome [Oscillatoriales cyanobacterium SM2_2_1]|nr:DASH family cryptochrome [Oscillatoriales cyanobacterium SM2_2_1]